MVDTAPLLDISDPRSGREPVAFPSELLTPGTPRPGTAEADADTPRGTDLRRTAKWVAARLSEQDRAPGDLPGSLSAAPAAAASRSQPSTALPALTDLNTNPAVAGPQLQAAVRNALRTGKIEPELARLFTWVHRDADSQRAQSLPTVQRSLAAFR